MWLAALVAFGIVAVDEPAPGAGIAMGAAARYRVQARVGSQWEHVGWCRTWKRVLALVGKPSQREPGWIMAGQTDTVRVLLRDDAEFRVVENLTAKGPGGDAPTPPGAG